MSKWISVKARLLAIALAGLAGSASYVVQPGDTLSAISVSIGTSVRQLVALNHLDRPDLIFPGQVLETGAGDSVARTRLEDTHVVKSGETLAGIARAHSVDSDTLVHTNGIVNGRVIVGTRLQLTPLPVDFEPSTIGRTHTVATGESISSIANAHGVSATQLMALNHVHEWDRLQAGRILTIAAGWQCPVSAGGFSNDWGWVKQDGRTHDGIDLFAARGAKVLAPVSGHLHQETGDVGGLQFTLWGDDGVRYFGSHMESFGASGDVRAGEVIGTVGTSGNALGTDPHLHFEVHPGDGDRSANPYPTLLSACG